MADLQDLVVLQARYVEFLRGQDEATVRAIIDGTAQLAAVPVGTTVFAPSTLVSSAVPTPSSTPRASETDHVAQELRRMTPGSQRSLYLNRARLTLSALRQVAKLLGINGYSKLRKAELVDLLAGYPDGNGAGVPTLPAPATVAGGVSNAAPEVAVVEPVLEPAPIESVGAVADPDAAAIAGRLRATETVDAGAAYLREQNLDRARLLAVAAELQLTRVDRLSRADLEKRVLKQAITARRKFAGLRKW
ncbi:Rho termination factor N-terminal domain-containing protein [Nocardia sp. NPDC058705]|uniref:Rho termination factor N-terminal domain-containing protein n=1 Tax=Nocardia sp. NPDC058705 TaxID=3346609 RepID=UPI00367E256A